jgi:hypothetical protein
MEQNYLDINIHHRQGFVALRSYDKQPQSSHKNKTPLHKINLIDVEVLQASITSHPPRLT